MMIATVSGNNWTLLPNTQDAPVVGLALLKEGNRTVMTGYRVLKFSPGLYRSADNGKTWQPLGSGTNGTILHLAIAPSNSQILYAVNENNAVFQSHDGGKTWKELVRRNERRIFSTGEEQSIRTQIKAEPSNKTW